MNTRRGVKVTYSPQHIKHILCEAPLVEHLFLVGGFAESCIVQEAIRQEFKGKVKVIIPQSAATAVLKGAVLYGLDPTIVHVRRARKTYGIGIIKPFVRGVHPEDKLSIRGGRRWCLDVFDKFVSCGESVTLGEAVLRRYRPVSLEHNKIVLGIFSSNHPDPKFITDRNVEFCGSLTLWLPVVDGEKQKRRLFSAENREIQAKMLFGDTEIKASAIDVDTGRTVKATIDFLCESNPKYVTKL